MLADEITQVAPVRTPPTDESRRRKGRPLEMAPDEVLQVIRRLGESGSLFRVHRDHPSLYARARRLFGSWAGAIGRAGFDHATAVAEARRRSVMARRMREAAPGTS